MIYKVITGCTVVVVMLCIYFFIQTGAFQKTPKVFFIALTEKGFYPSKVTIDKGDKVTFQADIDRNFWPASDLHPTHELYPEFDPRVPIAKDKTWTFQFKREGVWKFHDHLAPYFVGAITVIEK
ncbi:MAG: hypothetical protein RLZZ67_262 [Candidatus Parcubacteria bacterium]|jgi:plastocyanin